MSYNFLRDARYIKNSNLCRYDSIYGYSTDFSNNGNVDGWDIYNNIYMYGCWNNVLFGSTYLNECYIGRTTVFLSVDAEKYFYIEFLMKVVDENPSKVVKGLTKGKVMWKRTDDNDWSSDRTIFFDIPSVNAWEYYKLNLGPYKWWQGEINDLRFYPFVDAHADDKFFIKSIKITSDDYWMCTNTSCSFYQFYTHPCPGAGEPAYCEANSYKKIYNTVSGINSELLINIDDYGIERIELGTNSNISGNSLAKVIGNSISTINIGGYSYSLVEITEDNTLRISSGTSRLDSSVEILYSPAAEELCFYNSDKTPNFTTYAGKNPATGFDYASTRLLQTFELNGLLDGTDKIAYVHNPTQYSVEGGRRDFNEIGTSNLISELSDVTGYVSFNNSGKTIVDMSKRIDNNGKLTHFWVYGIVYSGASFKILRPHNDGSFTVIYTQSLPTKQAGVLYTSKPIVYRVECNVLVNKGDLLGIYNVDLFVGKTLTNLPDATFIQYDGDISGTIQKATSYSYGVGGFAMYARGDLKQNNTILDIDLGYRLNVSEFIIKGEELEGFFEFNVASCLDITWDVDLFGESHTHWGYYRLSGYGWSVTHQNVYYGKSCLDDLSITADNGQVGTSYGQSNGLASYGNNHSYFYVNGDAEWLYDYSCSNIAEFCGDMVPYGTAGFERDPIAFTLYFPNEKNISIHKSIMYFKEEKNFRRFVLSTYNGPYYFKGNADKNTFTMVPSYKAIHLNGTKYLYGDDTNIDKFLFKNPTSDDIYSGDYGDIDKVNNYIATRFVDWTILGNEFEPISCKGFRIYCNKHYSTKITELEVYSRIPNDVSMVDNAVLYFSDYQDLWRTTGFKNRTAKETYAFIGGTPRYFRLTLDSQTKFNMRELSVVVTDQTFVYDELILLEDARKNDIGRGKLVPIINTYNKAFDLTVDIPRDLGTHNNIVFWNTLSSLEDLQDTKLGPSCLFYKSNDFPITYYRGQCASNCYVYGLDNLVHNKKAYYCSNTFDWYYYGTIQKDISIDFINFDYLDQSRFKGTFTTVSSRYWRIYGLSSNLVTKITDIIITYLNSRVRLKNILLSENLPSTGLKYIPFTGSMFSSVTNFEDNFELGNFDNFILSGTNNPIGTIIDNSYLYINANNGTTTLASYSFNNTKNFEFNLEYMFDDRISTLRYMSMTFEFYASYTRAFYLKWYTDTNNDLYSNNCASTFHNFKIYSNDVEVYSSNTLGCYLNIRELNKINLRRAGGKVSLYLDDKNYITTFNIDSTLVINNFIFTANNYIDYINIYKINFLYSLLLAQGTYIDLELLSNDPADMVYLISTGSSLAFDIFTSYDKLNYNFTRTVTTVKEDLYTRFVIDLEKRHSLSIVRNYGTAPYKLDLSLQLNTSFSNSTGTIENAVFNSTFNDCRWLSLNILNSTMVLKELDKLGVYTNISNIYCLDGGYNNSWIALPGDITKHNAYKNIAFNTTVSGNVYYKDSVPENAVNGDTTTYNTSSCWGYKKGTTPTLYIEFGEEYSIGGYTMHNGYNPSLNYPLNKEYKLYLDNTISGTNYSYVMVSSITGITDNSVRTHEFTPVKARRAKLEILNFTTITNYEKDLDGNYSTVYLGYLREIEILAKEELLDIDSESYPIICVDLRDSFDVVGHKLLNKYKSTKPNPSDSGSNLWDNSEEFFSYSDAIVDDPKFVSFIGNKSYVNEYSYLTSTGNLVGSYKYIINYSLYLKEGKYFINWDAYYPENVKEMYLRFRGKSDVIIYAETYGTGWISQYNEFFVDSADYFILSMEQNVSIDNYWGVRNILIYRTYGLTKWVAVKRDTATNYSYDFNSNKFGKDYLGTIELYGSVKYNPTEYSWWWTSELAELSNSSIFTKKGKRSLVVNYPASTVIDILRLNEADTLGKDLNWSIYDIFSFYWYIDNINNIDTTFGKIVLGSIKNTANDFYYCWEISKISLETGWNEIRLCFDKYSSIYPTHINTASKYLKAELDIKYNKIDLSTFYIEYRGKGVPLSMCFDSFTISRNTFDTQVNFGNGLCLTYNDYLMVPLSNITLDKGSVEFWVKMGVNSLSMDAFGELHAATLFTISSNTNDIIALRIRPGNWFEVFAGNIRRQSLFSLDTLPAKSFIERNKVVHIGLVWSNDGSGTASGNTIQLYVNGVLTLSSNSVWEVSDTKLSFFKLGGGIAQTAQIHSNSSAFIYENLKVYNYCKDSFRPNKQDIEGDYIYSPEHFIEISMDNITYHKLGSENLPMVFEQVPPGESRNIYVRSIKNSKFSAKNSTAQIIIDWLTTV